MKKTLFTIIYCSILSLSAYAQFEPGSIDAYNVSQSDLRGTARFMSMAGAFGALGGDLSTLTQNPAGIGVYRSSEIALTLDFDFQNTMTQGLYKESQTKVYCNNFGYVGSLNLGGDLLKNFNWGATYSRKASFDRNYSGYFPSMPTSLSNYIASFTNGCPVSELAFDEGYDPYDGYSSPDWLSVMAYNSYLINPVGNTSYYNGLFNSSTIADSEFAVSERGYIDEYSINFGGNFADLIYWGLGIGINDLSFSQATYYNEHLNNATFPSDNSGNMTNGYAEFSLNNIKEISGSGYNIKLGVIVKPVDELRFGLAVHTPTWYSLNQSFDSSIEYLYSPKIDIEDDGAYQFVQPSYIPYFEYSLRSPWKFMLSAAGVIAGRFIVSADYEHDAYDSMTLSGTGRNFDTYDLQNQDIKTYFQSANSFRIGAEYRVTPNLSMRAGYSFTGDNVKNVAMYQSNTSEYIYTYGTDPSYTFNKTTQYFTCGIGYRFGRFYADVAFAHRNREAQYQPFTKFDNKIIPTAKVEQNDNNLIISVGYKF